MLCQKRPFSSLHAVRQAHRGAGFRVRAYLCDCGSYHGSNGDRRGLSGRGESSTLPDSGGITIAQEQAIVERAIERARLIRLSQGAR